MDYFVSRYISAVELLPPRLRAATMAVDDERKAAAEEFRLRVGRRMSVLLPDGELPLDGPPITPEDVSETAARAARGSLHSVSDELAAGFVTAQNGHRLGLCGRAVMENGSCRTMRDFSSANLRIAKEVHGAADGVFSRIVGDRVFSALILSPPGAGKTTLLRDLVRQAGDAGIRVSVADERGELSACGAGKPGFDVGECVDLMVGAPKSVAALGLLRSMNPQVVALDEITDPADFDAIARIVGCGAAVFATIHANGMDELRSRAGLASILPAFEKFVVIERSGGRRTTTVLDPPSES